MAEYDNDHMELMVEYGYEPPKPKTQAEREAYAKWVCDELDRWARANGQYMEPLF